MSKKILSLLMVIVLTFSFMTACTKKNNENNNQTTPMATTGENESTNKKKIDVKLAAMTGPTAFGLVKIMSDAKVGNTANNYKFSIHGTADEITTALVKGELDMACLPCNAASVLYNKTGGKIQVAAVNTLGVLYIVETGNSISSVSDLKGKTIYSTGQGTTPEYTLRYLLSKNGIDPDNDVEIVYKSEAAEVAALLKNADNAIAMLPQPYVASAMIANENIRIALSVTDEWEKVDSNSTVVTGVLVVRTEFAKEHPDVVNEFLKEYEASITYVNTNIEETAALLEEFEIFKAAVAKKAIPYCNVEFLAGDSMKEKVSGYLKALYDQKAASIGGAMPEDNFYYKAK